ncbi:hypothetical protein SE17_04940, partial [Kouleothrix aurantiaca]
ELFVWQGHHHVIADVLDRWRVDEGWWRWHVWREYFKVVTSTGLLTLIYHDVPSNTWRLQRVYD